MLEFLTPTHLIQHGVNDWLKKNIMRNNFFHRCWMVGSVTGYSSWPLSRTTRPLLPGKGAASERSRSLSVLGWKRCEPDAPTETATGDDPADPTPAEHAKSSRTHAAPGGLKRCVVVVMSFIHQFILSKSFITLGWGWIITPDLFFFVLPVLYAITHYDLTQH